MPSNLNLGKMSLVTTVEFSNTIEIGNPVSQAKIYESQLADELIGGASGKFGHYTTLRDTRTWRDRTPANDGELGVERNAKTGCRLVLSGLKLTDIRISTSGRTTYGRQL